MNRNHQGNALLVELLIVVLFFMLASTVLLQLFASARSQGDKAEALTKAMGQAQNIADTLYAAEDMEAALEELGFSPEGERWVLPEGKCTASVVLACEETGAGAFTRYTVSILEGEEVLITLPGARFEEASE
ncbi:MAG: hypothetical protein IJG40_11060 [Oscillospiraceae bacterium]|nr:hypothetical protein [Oscillospiraceae bacterium]